MKGICGKILHVNLTEKHCTVEKPNELFYRKYLGGGGLGSYYLLKHVSGDVDAFAPENVLVFAAGFLAGVPGSGLTRYSVVAKSPMNDGFGESEAAGFWGPELKFAGFDAIVIHGKADKPVYLWVHDGEYEIRDAAHLWGLQTRETHHQILDELGDRRIRIALIGPGGEKLVRYACILNELRHANGRSGMGAVMGSKNLKAIAVRGTQKPDWVDPQQLRQIARDMVPEIREKCQAFNKLGTPVSVMPLNGMGILPTKNFVEGQFDHAQEISGETMAETILVKPGTCYGCAVACKRVVKVDRDDFTVDPEYGGPEYETIGGFGSLCLIGDLEIIAKANELCQRYSIDTISTGVTIAFAMECYEKGLITRDDTGGIDLRFGNGLALLQMVELIAQRRAFGDLLAEGSLRAARKIGKDSEDFTMQVKGLETPLHDPRGKYALGLSYALSPTGADHLEAMFEHGFQKMNPSFEATQCLGILEPLEPLSWGPDKLRFFFHTQLVYNVFNSLGVCMLVGAPRPLTLERLVRQIAAVAGWKTSVWELLKAGEREGIMARLFNYRCGLRPKDDTLPKRFFEPLQNGALAGQAIREEDLRKAISLYYDMAGIGENGAPRKGKVLELGLEEFAD